MEHLTPPDLSNGIPSELPVEIPSQLSTVWVEPEHVRKSLDETFRTWARHARADDLRALAGIRVEIWAAERGLQAPPDVCLVYSERQPGRILGVLCGFPRHGHRDFFIQEVAIHPLFQWNPRASREIGWKLLEAAMDVSVQLGYFGWVSCAPDEREVPFWRELGFSRHDDFTYRRMGYFH